MNGKKQPLETMAKRAGPALSSARLFLPLF
jgi:hypothetical protein